MEEAIIILKRVDGLSMYFLRSSVDKWLGKDLWPFQVLSSSVSSTLNKLETRNGIGPMKIPFTALLSVIPQQKWSYRCHFNESIDVRLAIVLPVVLGICCFIIKPWHPQSEQVSSSSSHWIPHQTWDLKCSLPVSPAIEKCPYNVSRQI